VTKKATTGGGHYEEGQQATHLHTEGDHATGTKTSTYLHGSSASLIDTLSPCTFQLLGTTLKHGDVHGHRSQPSDLLLAFSAGSDGKQAVLVDLDEEEVTRRASVSGPAELQQSCGTLEAYVTTSTLNVESVRAASVFQVRRSM